MKKSMTLRSGATIYSRTREEAAETDLLTREDLTKMHLIPNGDPAAFEENADGSHKFFYDPETVAEAPVELWYHPKAKVETMKLPSGSEIPRMSIKRAAACGYHTEKKLSDMKYDIIEEPVAYSYRRDGSVFFFYDKKTALRRPLMCVKCGKKERFRKKLCVDCYEAELKKMRAEGDLHRNASYGMDRSEVLFFDLELTGFYDRDEIISISIMDGNGKVVMDTLVKPEHTKRWKKTEKIHGIAPAMTASRPTLKDLTPQIKEIFANAKAIIGYGVSTDYSHIKVIYATEEEREALHAKIRCCASEFVRYLNEYDPEYRRASLKEAMKYLHIEWDGVAHTSIADTIACKKVWEKLFPNYYAAPNP